MKTKRYSRRFRLQLILSLTFIALLIFAFNLYFFSKTIEIETYITQPVQTVQMDQILSNLDLIKKASFSFIIITLIITSTSLIHLVFTSSYALDKIFEGIQKIDEGDLSNKIQLSTDDEFAQISDFLNEATEHLSTKRKELIDAKEGVERIVEERTHELEVEKNKLSTTFAHVMDAVIAVDENGTVQIFNAAAERATGHTASEAIGKYIESLITFQQENKQISFVEYCPTALLPGSAVSYSKSEVLLTGKSDKQIYVNLTSARISQDESHDLGWIITLHDVTEEKQLEDMKIDFVSMAAHELRTPLTSIRGYLALFMDENEGKFDETQRRFLNRIQISTSQLLGLIENLLNVSKIERGAITLKFLPTDWIAIVKQSVDTFHERAADKKITLTFSPPAEMVPKVLVDTVRVTEVLDNLLSNAITYTKANGTISVSLEQKDNYLITHITDTGEGIPPAAIPNLFKKFFRVSGKLEQGSKGNGLGLYISKSIIDMHKGTIWVNSTLNEGSTFSFSLPIITENL